MFHTVSPSRTEATPRAPRSFGRARAGAIVRVALLAAAACFVADVASTAQAAPIGQLRLIGQKKTVDRVEYRDFIAQGKTWNITGGEWSATVFPLGGAQGAQASTVSVRVTGLPAELGLFWSAEFCSERVGVPLRTGAYTNAMRHPFEDLGRPGIDVSGDGRGNNTQNGNFTIQQLAVDYSGSTPRLTLLAATFIQYEGDSPDGLAVRGSVFYRDDGQTGGAPGSFPLLDRVKYQKRNDTLILKGSDFQPGAVVLVDGQPVAGASVRSTSVRVKNLVLAPGLHTVVLRNPDGGETFTAEVAVFSFYRAEDLAPLDLDEADEAFE